MTSMTMISREYHAEKYRNAKKEKKTIFSHKLRTKATDRGIAARIARSKNSKRVCIECFAVRKALRKVDRQEDRRASETRFLPQYHRRCFLPHRRLATEQRGAADRSAAAWSVWSSWMQLSPDAKDQTVKFPREGCGVSPSYRRRVTGKEKIQRAGITPLRRYARIQHHSCILYLAWPGPQYRLHLQRAVYARASRNHSRLISQHRSHYPFHSPFPFARSIKSISSRVISSLSDRDETLFAAVKNTPN